MIMDHSGNLWIGTRNYGLLKRESGTGRFFSYKNNAGDGFTLSSDNILCLYEDNEGILWTGTKGGGVSKRRFDKFTHYKRLPGNPGAISANSVWSLYKDRSGNLWAGTEDGLNRLNQKRDRFEVYKHDPDDFSSLSDNSVYAIFEDRKGDFWIGTSNGGLNLMDRSTGKFKRYYPDPGNPKSLSYDFVRAIAEDKEGNLWIGTRGGGLNKLDPKRETFTTYKHEKGNSNSLSHDRINSLIIDREGILWIATSGGGLNRFDPRQQSFRCYTVDSSKHQNINDAYAMALCEDKKGRLWVGTYSGGLNLLDKKNGTFTHFTVKNGLPNNLIYGIVEDNQGKIWLSTNKGLSKFDPDAGTFENFDMADGLQDIEFNAGAFFRGQDGELLFGGINGFNVFFPEKIYRNTVVPPIIITDFRVENKEIIPGENSLLKKSIITTDEINLSYRDYFFSFEFTSLSFVSNSKNKYAYKLEGFDKNWIQTDFHNRIATYTNLRGGNYIFRVIASNNDGIWNETGTAIKLTIEPPFWQTWGFRISALIILVLGLVAFYRYRVHNLEKQKRLLESAVLEKNREVLKQKEELELTNQKLTFSNEELQVQREELQMAIQTLKDAQFKLVQSEKMASLGVLLAGVAHEINNPLNFILGGYNGLYNIFKEKEISGGKTEIFLDAIKTGVDRATGIINGLNNFSRNNEGLQEECDIHSILDSCLAIISYQLKHKIELIRDFTTESVLVNGNVGKLHQVFINVLTNAVHAIENEGVISIVTRRGQDMIIIEITDNGCGISETDLPKITDPFFTTKDPGKGTGLGLSIVYSIIQEHKGNLHIRSEVSKGTTILIELPAKNNQNEKA
jgi:signal transduction histidine kinase/streptogramin lyase